MGPLRRQLRVATALPHERVEAAFAGYDLSRRADYAAFLTCHGAVLAPLERVLEAAGIADHIPDWPRRSRRAALARDLGLLGLPEPAPRSVAMPKGTASLLGMAYVLEGSRLGATLLLQRALASADPSVRAATLFLGHGRGDGLWASFLDLLEASPAAQRDPDAIAEGARTAFAAFEAAALAARHPGARHVASAS